MSTTDISMYKSFYDIGKSTIWGEKTPDGNSPRLLLSFRDGNPRLVVYTGEMGVIINFPTDYMHFMAVLERLEVVAKGQNGIKASITSLSPVYKDDKPTKEKRVVSTLRMGKTKEGMIYIMLEEEGKPKVPFGFNKSEWHDFLGDNKESENVETLSRYFALGYIKLLRNVASNALSQYTKEAYTQGEYKPYQIQNNNQKGKGNKGQGFVKKPVTSSMNFDDYDEDIPL